MYCMVCEYTLSTDRARAHRRSRLTDDRHTQLSLMCSQATLGWLIRARTMKLRARARRRSATLTAHSLSHRHHTGHLALLGGC